MKPFHESTPVIQGPKQIRRRVLIKAKDISDTTASEEPVAANPDTPSNTNVGANPDGITNPAVPSNPYGPTTTDASVFHVNPSFQLKFLRAAHYLLQDTDMSICLMRR